MRMSVCSCGAGNFRGTNSGGGGGLAGAAADSGCSAQLTHRRSMLALSPVGQRDRRARHARLLAGPDEFGLELGAVLAPAAPPGWLQNRSVHVSAKKLSGVEPPMERRRDQDDFAGRIPLSPSWAGSCRTACVADGLYASGQVILIAGRALARGNSPTVAAIDALTRGRLVGH